MIPADVQAALAALDRALVDRPNHVYGDLTDAVRCLVELRDRLIEERRAGDAAGDRLGRLNAVMSLVITGEYPLEGIRRARIEEARDELARLFAAAD